MTVKAKAIIAAYYGTSPKLSYWNGYRRRQAGDEGGAALP